MIEERPPVAVLGGFGFIGGHLVERLSVLGHTVTVLGRPAPSLEGSRESAGVRYVYGDFANAADVRDAIEGAQIVFNLVGSTVPQSSNENPRYDVEANLVPALSFLEMCGKLGVKQVVFASSGGTVYGVPQKLPIGEDHPTYPICAYGIQKLTVEHYMRLFHRLSGVAMTVLRLANPYGSRQNIKRGQGIIGTFCRRLAAGEPLQVWGDGSVVRDYIHVSDVVTAMERVVGRAEGYRVYNIGTGVGTSVNDLVSYLRALFPRPFEVEYFPSRPVDVPSNILDASRFRAEFSWQPEMAIERGLRETVAWYMAQK